MKQALEIRAQNHGNVKSRSLIANHSEYQGLNSYIRGGLPHGILTIERIDSTTSPQETMKHYNKKNAPVINVQVSNHHSQTNAKVNFLKDAQRIRKYSVTRFVEVVSHEGEYLLAYAEGPNDPNPGMVYYHTPGMLEMIQIHGRNCHCKNCIWTRECKDEPTPQASRVQPGFRRYDPTHSKNCHYGLRSSPKQVQYGRRAGTKTPPEMRSPSPVQYSPSPTYDYDDSWDGHHQHHQCHHWNVEPRELTEEEKQLNAECDELLSNLAMKDLRYPEYFLNCPEHDLNRKLKQALAIKHHLDQANSILDEILKGHQLRGSTHREYNLYLAECEHQVKHWSAESYCGQCRVVELDLDSEGYVITTEVEDGEL